MSAPPIVTLVLTPDDYVIIRMALSDRADKFHTWLKIDGILPGERAYCNQEISTAEKLYDKIGALE